MGEDIRTTALLDQLNEIDRREAEVLGAGMTRRLRIANLVSVGVSLLIMERLGAPLLLIVLVLLPVIFASTGLARLLVRRRFDRERARRKAVYEAIDQAKISPLSDALPGGGVVDESSGEGDVS